MPDWSIFTTKVKWKISYIQWLIDHLETLNTRTLYGKISSRSQKTPNWNMEVHKRKEDYQNGNYVGDYVFIIM